MTELERCTKILPNDGLYHRIELLLHILLRLKMIQYIGYNYPRAMGRLRTVQKCSRWLEIDITRNTLVETGKKWY